MIDLSPCDSPPGEMPKRAEDTPFGPTERILHVHLGNPTEPQTGLIGALRDLTDVDLGGLYRQVDWTQFSLKHGPKGEWSEFERATVVAAEDIKPTLVFMQLQTLDVVDAPFLVELRDFCDPNAVFVSWCGDVGRDPMWSHCVAPYFDAMLFSSMTQVEEHRAAGFPNAAYLQIGYDTDIHFVDPEEDRRRNGQVLFFGQNYNDNGWTIEHEAQLRRDVVLELAGGLPPVVFEIYGSGWNRILSRNVRPMPREGAAHAYQNSAVAVSMSLTSKLKRYSSDRLLRALACGPVVLVKRFEEMPSWGLKDKENCLVWDTPEHCLALAQLVRGAQGYSKEYYSKIGAAGAKLAREHHTWPMRMHEMQIYVDYIRSHR